MIRRKPRISVILIAYKMRDQMQNTLRTLAPDYQSGCSADDYEVVVVENASDENLDQATIDALPSNFRYFLRREKGHSPVPAINFAFRRCRGHYIGLIMDGARMLSPGVIHNALTGWRATPNALTVIPGYHLGRQEQHLHENVEQALAEERALLDSVQWEQNGYELFTISTLSGANRRGYLHPIMECNCLFASRRNYRRIGYADKRFTQPGGGSINLHMYRRLGMLPDTELFVVPGEGSFHQFHGGVSTSGYAGRDAELDRHRRQLHGYWPGGFHALRREPTLLGAVPPQALHFLHDSVMRSGNRYSTMREAGRDLWPDDPGTDKR